MGGWMAQDVQATFFGLGATRKTRFVNTGETKLANKDQTKVPSTLTKI